MTTTRTRTQHALATSDAAWRWYLAGYERGLQTGYDRGAQDVVDDIKHAGRALAEHLPAVRREIDARKARAARVDPADTETTTDRAARCAASWGIPPTTTKEAEA